jgi:hypothetical protein
MITLISVQLFFSAISGKNVRFLFAFNFFLVGCDMLFWRAVLTIAFQSGDISKCNKFDIELCSGRFDCIIIIIIIKLF